MAQLFLDIETYVSKENENSGLNPYEKESKVIVISYAYYSGFKPPAEEQIKKPIFLKEWESSEKDMLAGFYDFLKKIQDAERYLPKFIGFNILSFDLPYLFGRMKMHDIADESELHFRLFRPFAVDMYQLTPMISEDTKKFEQLWGINQKKASEFFDLRVKEGRGDELSRFYDRNEFDKIMRYCEAEFNFEQMMNAFYLFISSNVTRDL